MKDGHALQVCVVDATRTEPPSLLTSLEKLLTVLQVFQHVS